MTCHVTIAPRCLHAPEITLDVPSGMARCRACRQAITAEDWLWGECTPPPIPCAHCGASVHVPGPDHALMRVLGMLCPVCYRAQDDARRMIG